MRFLPRLALIVLLITPLRALAQPFTLSITPKTQSYTGVAPVYTISGAPGSGFSASIYLSAHSDALPGTTFSLSSNKINPPYNSTVTLTVTLPTYYTNGTHAIIVEGSNGPALARDTCWLVIDVPPKTGWTVYNTYNSGVPSNEINDVSFEPGGAIWVSTHKGGSV